MSGREKTWLHGTARVDPKPMPPPMAEELPGPGDVAGQEEDLHPSRAYGGLWSRRDRAHTVEFRFLDPDKADESFDYNYMPRVSWHKGRGEIGLLYDTLGVTVTIRGLNLSELKERLRQHLVTWVQEQGADPITIRRAQEQARSEGRELVFVQEIRIVQQHPKPDGLV